MTFDPSFWRNEKTRLLAILLPRLTQMSFEAAKQAAQKAGIGFNPALANANAANWARSYTDTLLDQLGTTSEKGIGDLVGKWVETPSATYGELQKSLMAFGAVRAQAIAVTETTRAYSEGEEMAYKQEGITEWTWRTNKDELVCPYCKNANNLTKKIGEKFGDFHGHEITKPPHHPNCRCWVSPAVKPNAERAAVVKKATPPPVMPGTQVTADAQVQPKERKFVEAINIREANNYAKDKLGLKFADYKGADLKAANEWNRAITDTFERIPELKQQTKAAGTAQAMYANLVDFHTQKVLSDNKDWMTQAGYSDEKQLQFAQSRARRKVKKTPGNAYAISYSKTLNDTDGIFINREWSLEKLELALKRNEETGWHPIGTGSIKAVADHEFGHQVDTLLNLKGNTELSALYSSFSKADIESGLSKYASKEKAEFIAEAWAEYLNNPTPRPIAQKVGDLIIRTYNGKYGK